MYKHFTLDDRFTLATLLNNDYEQLDIVEIMGRSESSISREISRNSRPDGKYEPRYANMLAKRRRKKSKINYRKIENDRELSRRIEEQLHPLVSPEVIAHDKNTCHETIYAWIYRSRPDLKSMLPQRGKKRRRYGSKRGKKQGWTANVRNIEEQPLGARNRSRVRHFEGDTIKLDGGAILTHTDRKSRFEIAHLVPDETADVAYEIIKDDKYLKAAKSITYDRGSTFALWRMIEKHINGKVYFANAHHPWERGTNENSNQRLRRIFPKGTKYNTITEKDVAEVVKIMNHTKRKCLNWRTPHEVFMDRCTSN
jgi:transposase, IS30 family